MKGGGRGPCLACSDGGGGRPTPLVSLSPASEKRGSEYACTTSMIRIDPGTSFMLYLGPGPPSLLYLTRANETLPYAGDTPPDWSAVLLQHRSLESSFPASVPSSLSALSETSLAPISDVGSSHGRLELDALLGFGLRSEDHPRLLCLPPLRQNPPTFPVVQQSPPGACCRSRNSLGPPCRRRRSCCILRGCCSCCRPLPLQPR